MQTATGVAGGRYCLPEELPGLGGNAPTHYTGSSGHASPRRTTAEMRRVFLCVHRVGVSRGSRALAASSVPARRAQGSPVCGSPHVTCIVSSREHLPPSLIRTPAVASFPCDGTRRIHLACCALVPWNAATFGRSCWPPELRESSAEGPCSRLLAIFTPGGAIRKVLLGRDRSAP